MLPEAHEGHAVSTSKRQIPLNSLNSDENVRAGIGIGFQKTIAKSGGEFHTNAELPFVGLFGFNFAISSPSKVICSAQRAPPAVDRILARACSDESLTSIVEPPHHRRSDHR
jgi:hypothetical protein